MYYSGGMSPRYQIGRAVSVDGLAWQREPEAPVLAHGDTGAWDASSVSPGSVLLLDDGTYLLYYHGYRTSVPEMYGVGVATSASGIDWERHPDNPILTASSFGGDRIFLPHTIRLSNRLFALMAEVLYGNHFEIVLATSEDGIHFAVENSGESVFRPEADQWDNWHVANPKLSEISPGRYLMGYNGASGLNKYCIGLASSENLLDWTRYESNPVLRFGAAVGIWDEHRIEGPIIPKEDLGGRWCRMWYFGGTTDEEFAIAVAACDQDEPEPAFLAARSEQDAAAWQLACPVPERFAAEIDIRKPSGSTRRSDWILMPALVDVAEVQGPGTVDELEPLLRFWVEVQIGGGPHDTQSFRISYLDANEFRWYWDGAQWVPWPVAVGTLTAGPYSISLSTVGSFMAASITNVAGDPILGAPAIIQVSHLAPFDSGYMLVIGEPFTDQRCSNIDLITVHVRQAAEVEPVIVMEGEVMYVASLDAGSSGLDVRPVNTQPGVLPVTYRILAPREVSARVQVFDLSGRLVRDYGSLGVAGGERIISWDGTDATELAVGSGVYFLSVAPSDRLNYRMTKKIVIVR